MPIFLIERNWAIGKIGIQSGRENSIDNNDDNVNKNMQE